MPPPDTLGAGGVGAGASEGAAVVMLVVSAEVFVVDAGPRFAVPCAAAECAPVASSGGLCALVVGVLSPGHLFVDERVDGVDHVLLTVTGH